MGIPKTKPAPKEKIDLSSFSDLSDDQKATVNGDVGLVAHVSREIVRRIADNDKETLRLLHLAFSTSGKPKEFEFLQGYYAQCAESLKTVTFKLDARPGGPCIVRDLLGCFIANVDSLQNVIVLSNLESLSDYFSATHRERAKLLIHEYCHLVGRDSEGHPGGVMDLSNPPIDNSNSIPYKQASRNAHCYGNFAYWMMKIGAGGDAK